MKNLLKKSLVACSILACGAAILSPKSFADQSDAKQAQVQLSIIPGEVTIWINSGVLANLELDLGNVPVSNSDQVLSWAFGADAFWLSDQKWAEIGYYTTVSVSNLDWTVSGHVIPATNVRLKSSGLHVMTWEQWQATIGLSTGNFAQANGELTYFQRTETATADAGVLGKFGDNLKIEVTVPAHTIADHYQGTITYTLYDEQQPN